MVHSHIAIQERSAVRLSLTSENFHIFLEGLRKHFHHWLLYPNSTTNVKIIFDMNNTIYNN